MKLIDYERLTPLRNRLKSSLASGFGSESQIARECLALLDAALSHADRMAAAERGLIGVTDEWAAKVQRERPHASQWPETRAVLDATNLLRSLRQSPATTDADAFYGVSPIVVVKDRYNGSYSGGRWVAWNGEGVPTDSQADDATCDQFWRNVRAENMDSRWWLYGLGDTPGEAVADLEIRVRARARARAG